MLHGRRLWEGMVVCALPRAVGGAYIGVEGKESLDDELSRHYGSVHHKVSRLFRVGSKSRAGTAVRRTCIHIGVMTRLSKQHQQMLWPCRVGLRKLPRNEQASSQHVALMRNTSRIKRRPEKEHFGKAIVVLFLFFNISQAFMHHRHGSTCGMSRVM